MGRDDVGVERTPDGRRVSVARTMAAPPADAWDLLTDTRRWPEWGPTVRGVEAADRFVRAGTTGHVRTVGGVRVPFEVVTCADRRWTWDVARIPATGHRVEAVSGDRCRVVFEVPLWAGGYAPVCWRALGNVERLLR